MRTRWLVLGCALAIGVALNLATVASASRDVPRDAVDPPAQADSHEPDCVEVGTLVPEPATVCWRVHQWSPSGCEEPSRQVEAEAAVDAHGVAWGTDGSTELCRDASAHDCRVGEEYRVGGQPLFGVCLAGGPLYPCEVGYENVGYVVVSGVQVEVPACVEDVPGPDVSVTLCRTPPGVHVGVGDRSVEACLERDPGQLVENLVECITPPSGCEFEEIELQ